MFFLDARGNDTREEDDAALVSQFTRAGLISRVAE